MEDIDAGLKALQDVIREKEVRSIAIPPLITETIPSRVAVDTAFRNARRNSDRENARIEHDRALLRVMTSVMKDDTELFKQFMDNDGFKRWMTDTVFGLACERAGMSSCGHR